MDVEDVDERIERETRRVAAAFSAQEFCFNDGYMAQVEGATLMWFIDEETAQVDNILLVSPGDSIGLVWDVPSAFDYRFSRHGTMLARGLYRLGFQDKNVLRRMPVLTAHEKLELRLSMPREFWPQTWLEEDTESPESSVYP